MVLVVRALMKASASSKPKRLISKRKSFSLAGSNSDASLSPLGGRNLIYQQPESTTYYSGTVTITLPSLRTAAMMFIIELISPTEMPTVSIARTESNHNMRPGPLATPYTLYCRLSGPQSRRYIPYWTLPPSALPVTSNCSTSSTSSNTNVLDFVR